MNLRRRQHNKPVFPAEFGSPPAESSSYAAVSNFHKDPLTGLIYGGRCNLNHMLIYLLLWSQGNNAPVIPAQAGI